jgi:outer membrane protein assembly factor BamB
VRRGLIAAIALLVVVGGLVAFVLLHEPGNVSNPQISFTTSTTTTTTAPPLSKHRPAPNNFLWARYGYDAARTRDFSGPRDLAPPLHTGWVHHDYALLEFPPSIYQHALFLMNDGGWVKSISTLTGRQLWQRRVGTLAAASPAIGPKEGMIYVPVLSDSGLRPGNGRVVALSIRGGHLVWSKPLPAGSESSPIEWDGSLYLGDQSGAVYSLNARTGRVNWTYHASGAVKGGPAYANGKLYFGDYAGRAYCLNAANGHQVWAVSTSGAEFGFGSGNFYSTPAVAYGRVYMGNTDGFVYSFAAGNGALAWATGTGAYVYASPAVATVPKLGPTVYLGSYSGGFYAFNARSGAIRWRHVAGGRISGSATIVNNIVYYSDLRSRTTTGLDAQTGRAVFSYRDGAFSPVIADDSSIFLVGYDTLYELVPVRAKHATSAHRKPHRAQKRAKRRQQRVHKRTKRQRQRAHKRAKRRATRRTNRLKRRVRRRAAARRARS